ncbi:HipA family kinase [Burkholderia sp. RF4-BP95]|uniref:HipA family kinase n=1 Tax=Burkholderia sp. RF4-BP95 TaxID=1637845 RepID=UPI000AE4755A|nr:HipA family kinase [Burkholderia sp. RF4-BP95]
MSIVLPPFELARLYRDPFDLSTTTAHPVVKGRIQVPVRACGIDAYVKLLPELQFCIESVCAWLARELGLPMPEVFWVTVHRGRMHGFWPFGDAVEQRVCFGTGAIPVALPVRLTSQTQATLTGMYGLDALFMAKIALFDELIGNDDRHDGNMLLTPNRTIVLIDHERALGGTGLDLFSSQPPLGPNRLLERVRELPLPERATLKADLRHFCAACVNAVLRLPYEQLVHPEVLREPMRQYLQGRAEKLRDTLESTLGIRDLPGLNPPGLQPSAT